MDSLFLSGIWYHYEFQFQQPFWNMYKVYMEWPTFWDYALVCRLNIGCFERAVLFSLGVEERPTLRTQFWKASTASILLDKLKLFYDQPKWTVAFCGLA